MNPTAEERDALFQAFARALFRNDMDVLYQVVTKNFVWRYHDGIGAERVLTGRDAIQRHIEERKAFFSSSRFHDVAYHHRPDISFMTFRVSETVRATGEQRELQGHRALPVRGRQACDQGCLSQADRGVTKSTGKSAKSLSSLRGYSGCCPLSGERRTWIRARKDARF
jgi:hypothetical protein